MTTFEGKSASYVAGKVPINKEALYTGVGKKLLEDLYIVHRKRVLNVQKTVDDRVRVLDFLTDTSWKMISRRHEELRLMKHNEEFYARLSKLENSESAYVKEQKRHQKHIKGLSEYSQKLKAHGRKLKLDKINRENEHLHHKISKATPFYSRDKMLEEYKRNVHQISSGKKKADYTAGHLLSIPKELAPPRLVKGSLSASSVDLSLREMKRKLKSQDSKFSKSSQFQQDSSFEPSLYLRLGNPSTVLQNGTSLGSLESLNYSNDDDFEPYEDEEDKEEYENDYDVTPVNEGNESGDAADDITLFSEGFAGEKIFLISRPFPMPFDTKNCLVEVLMSKDYDEQIHFKAVHTHDRAQVIVERSITIDDVHDILEVSKSISKLGINEDLQALRTVLTNMFKEADKENRGYLSFDEFQSLMSKINLGISPEELRFVVSEADEDENGFIDYQEFVPLAVDMIQAFVARSRARNDASQHNAVVEDQVLQAIATEELQTMVHVFDEKFAEYDTKKTGFLRTQDLRKILHENMQIGISLAEVNMICQICPRDAYGRSDIREFRKALFDVRFTSMKNTVIESQATDLEKYLFDLCHNEEARLKELKTDESFMNMEGMLPLRCIMNLMIASPRLSLNRLQVVVVASEAKTVEGLVYYPDFIPVAAKTIEIMYEPHALKQRAELIEKTDLSPETLLEGLSPEVFKRRLLTLFKSCDTDKSGFLDMKEFRQCLESLDLKLTPSEIQALMASADSDGNGTIDFEEFAEFCSHNLIHLEREKHIRALQESLKHTSTVRKSFRIDEEDLETHLRSIFRIADTNCSGLLSHTEIQNLFRSLDINLTPFELSVIFSESDTNHDGLINYEEFVPVCVDLLKVLRADQDLKSTRTEGEHIAVVKANEICKSIRHEIDHTCKFVRANFDVVKESIEDSTERAKVLKEILRDPHSGLSKQEANSVYIRILSHDLNFKHERRITVHDALKTAISTGNVRDINLNDLEEMIMDARKTSLVRNFMEDYDKGFVKEQILKMLEEIAIENDADNYIPVRFAYECLEKMPSLRLHRAEIISIISFADCYDETGQFIDVKKFAPYAAGCIENLTNLASMENRALATKKGDLNERKVMNGMTEYEIRGYLEKELLERPGVAQNHNLITGAELSEIISNIPGIYLTKKESVAVISSLRHTKEGHIDIREFLKIAYPSLVSICFERYLSRRAKLVGHNNNGDAIGLTALAERLLDILKLKLKGDEYLIVFPAEEHLDSSRRISLVYIPTGSSPPSSQGGKRPLAVWNNLSQGDDKNSHTVTMSGQSALLMRYALSLPIEIIMPTKPLKKAPSFNGRRVTEILKDINDASSANKNMYGMASIYENDTFTFPDKAPLEFQFISADSSFVASMPMPIRMPSLGLVDVAVAEEFAEQLVRFFFVEYESDTNTYTLKFNESDL